MEEVVGQQFISTEVPSPLGQDKPKKRKKGRWILVVLAVLLVGVGIVLFVLGANKNKETEPEPTTTPLIEGLRGPDTLGDSEEVVDEPETVDRAEVSIEILNGTGISGEASYLQGVLGKLDYEDIELGNASDQDYETTEVTFSSDVADTLVDELTDKLEEIYETVETKKSRSLTSVDIRIITGLRAGATAKPVASPSASPDSSPSAKIVE